MVGPIDKFIHTCPSSFLGKYYFHCSEIQESYVFSSSHGWMWELDHKEGWAPNNICFQIVVLKKMLESPLDSKEIKSINPKRKTTLNTHWKNWCWSWSSNTLATLCEESIYWKRPWCWERLKAGGGEDNRGCSDWMASPTQWTWVWANSGKEWRTGKPCVLQPMGSQKSQTQLSDWTTSFLIPRPCGQWDWPSLDPGSLL